MPSRIVTLMLPFFVLAVAIAGYVAVDYSRSLRHVPAASAPSFADYAAARFDRFTGRDAVSASETVPALGVTPGVAAAAPAAPAAEPVTGGPEEQAPVRFSCSAGAGGSKVCSALKD
jgi:hypothetical protein